MDKRVFIAAKSKKLLDALNPVINKDFTNLTQLINHLTLNKIRNSVCIIEDEIFLKEDQTYLADFQQQILENGCRLILFGNIKKFPQFSFDDIIKKSLSKKAIQLKIELHLSSLRQVEILKNTTNIKIVVKTLFEDAPIGVMISKEDKSKNGGEELEYVNKKYLELAGRSEEDIAIANWETFTHPDDLKIELKRQKEMLDGKVASYTFDKRYIHPDGKIVWVQLIAAILDFKPYRYLVLIQDITEQKTVEGQLAESERSKRTFMSHLPGMAYRCKYDQYWTMEFVSEGVIELFGYEPSALVDNKEITYGQLIVPPYQEMIRKEIDQSIKKREPFKIEYEVVTKGGKRKWVYEKGQGIYEEDGGVKHVEGIILDISERKEMEKKYNYYYQRDRVTGLYNFTYFDLLLKEQLLTDSKKIIIGINLTSVHQLVARYRYSYTQLILFELVKKLEELCSENIQLFSLYENWLALYVNKYRDKEEIVELLTKVKEVLNEVLGSEFVGWGIGIVDIKGNTDLTTEQIFKNLMVAADKSLDSFDDEFRVVHFDADLEKLLDEENLITDKIVDSTNGNKEDSLYLEYQPIIDTKTDKIWAIEALSRMKIETLGVVTPAQFIPIAEKTKLIVPLGERIIEKALAFHKEIAKKTEDKILISINISPIQLLSEGFVEQVEILITKSGVDAKNVIFEITETAVALNFVKINLILNKLRELGILIALDDFGTGYSSLHRGSELGIDFIKIDKTFIDQLLLVARQSITSDIISMAHKVGHKVIAEGVEYVEQQVYLIEHKCDYLQGYSVSEPLKEQDILNFIEQNR